MRVGLHRMIVIDICRDEFRVARCHSPYTTMESGLVFELIDVSSQSDADAEGCFLSGVLFRITGRKLGVTVASWS